MNLSFQPDPHYPLDRAQLPSSWALVPLGDVVRDIRSGFSSTAYTDPALGVVHLRPMNISRKGKIVLEDIRYVASEREDLRLSSGDVLFNNTNSAELVGKTAPIDSDEGWAFSNHMTRLRPPLGLSHRFLAYQLLFLWETGYFRYISKQHVNQAGISQRKLSRSVPLVVAPPTEQLRLVSALEYHLGRIDAAAALLDRTLSRIAEYRRRILQESTVGTLPILGGKGPFIGDEPSETGEKLLRSLIPQENRTEAADVASAGSETSVDAVGNAGSGRTGLPMDTNLPSLPATWTWARVGQVGEVMVGRQRSPKDHRGPNMRPYLRVANVLEDRIEIENVDVKEMNFTVEEFEVYQLRRNDILLNEGQSAELAGRPAMFQNEVPGACFQNTLIRFRAHNGVSPRFALLVFRHYLHSGRFRSIAKWSTNIAHLGLSRFAGLEFPLPPLAEQERIVEEASRRFSAADALEETVRGVLDRIAQARFRSLEEAFTGRLVAQDPSEGTVEELLREAAALPEPPRVPRGSYSQRRRSKQSMNRRPMLEVLKEAGGSLSPSVLLEQSGIGEDLIDEFYRELKIAEAKGSVVELREVDDVRITLVQGEP
jgi:type I restriction enzyme S subunit